MWIDSTGGEDKLGQAGAIGAGGEEYAGDIGVAGTR